MVHGNWAFLDGEKYNKWFTASRLEREMHCWAACEMRQKASQVARRNCNERLALFTTKRQRVLLQGAEFSKNYLKHILV
jgi:hypothetical protein